jgi:uncharacterized repeat protein (TIGR03803 family)
VHPFTGNSTGYSPFAGLVIGADGNLYGTTFYGGSSGVGVVFKMAPQPNGRLTETIVDEFTGCTATECPDGLYPFGGLVFDAAGNLYGTTEYGGAAGQVCNPPDSDVHVRCGIVFKLAPGAHSTWDHSIGHRFPGGADGFLAICLYDAQMYYLNTLSVKVGLDCSVASQKWSLGGSSRCIGGAGRR